MELFLLLIGLALLVAWLGKRARPAGPKRRTGQLQPEGQVRVNFDDERIVVAYPNDEARSLRWDELTKVRIRTTDEGPFVADVFWGLHGRDGALALVFPQGATGDGALLEAIQQRLRGFDNRRLIEAMGCANNADFLLWEKYPQTEALGS
ncbi:MAG: hypothetical protein ACXU8N_21525 [Telluria sp.]